MRNSHLPRYREDDKTLNLFNSLKTSDAIKEAELFKDGLHSSRTN